MATTAGGSVALWSRLSSSCSPHKSAPTTSSFSVIRAIHLQRRNFPCFAVQQESSTSTESVAETNEKKEVKNVAEDTAEGAKPKAAAKAPAKALPELMEEDVIPSLKTIIETQQDIIQLDLSFSDNKLEGSFLKNGNPYSFWVFFADGSINGPKGFSISSYGAEVSTVEPFLVDEKKPTAKQVVFWVEKRLAAQGIIPVWKD